MPFTRHIAITGASRGLGLEFAKQLSQNPAHQVIAFHRSRSTGLDELEGRGNVERVFLELRDDKGILEAARKAGQITGGKLDLLINVAGVSLGRQPATEKTDLKMLKDSMQINLYGPLLLTNALLPYLHQGKEKKIVNLTSRLGSMSLVKTFHTTPEMSLKHDKDHVLPYAISKAGVNMLTTHQAWELFPHGFTVAAFHPGRCRTSMCPNGTIDPQDSVRVMVGKIEELGRGDSGGLFWVGDDLGVAEGEW